MDDPVTITDQDLLQSLLTSASRTFAINIPMLPGLLREALTLGYLLLRNADTLEDAYRWPKERRLAELEQLHGLLRQPSEQAAHDFVARYQSETALAPGPDLELLRQTPYLLDQIRRLPEAYALEVLSHVARVVRRMEQWVARHDESNHLQIERLSQLDDYCYSVAGIVGELVTSLIALYRPALDRTRLLFLRTLETGVGAGLQLTNIIKDAFRDRLEGRNYIPPEYLPVDGRGSLERMKPMFAYAYRHLSLGVDYTCTLPEHEVDIRKAVFVPLLLASATLVHLLERIEDLFAGIEVKISRETVGRLLVLAEGSAPKNQAVRRAWQEVSGPLLALHTGLAAP